MVRYFCHAERASEAFAALLLQKSLKQRMWTGSATETRQVPGLGGVTAARLAAAGVHSLRQLAAVEPRKLEALAQRPYPWGSETHDAVQRRLPPPLTLECVPLGWAPGGRLDLQLTLTRGGSGDGSDAAGQGGAAADDHSRSSARLLVGTLHDNALLCCRALCLDSFASPLTFRLRTRTAAAGAGERGTPIQVVASVVHERLVGVDVSASFLRITRLPAGSLHGCMPKHCQARVDEDFAHVLTLADFCQHVCSWRSRPWCPTTPP
jgi:ATP-dependent DNA helicase HFM1/MER3